MSFKGKFILFFEIGGKALMCVVVGIFVGCGGYSGMESWSVRLYLWI